jgi:methylmalonyl-CoA epimerase
MIRAYLDHVGVAVTDLETSLRFFRDALGLHVEASEEVGSQHVRATFLPMGPSSLELLEATAPASPIARFIEARGPGMHHVALRVDDIRATLAALEARGVRLIDRQPRPGAEGAEVAFIHPSATHGVLVELKQPAVRVPRFLTAAPVTVGNVELISLSDGFIHLDGGAMFGVVPRTLWASKIAPDDRHRIPLGMRPLLIRGDRNILIDAGCGDKMDDRAADIYGLERAYHLDHSLADVGLSADDIDIVVASHLHFDHVGGFTRRDGQGHLVPRFPKARYVAHGQEWHDATHPHERNRASYLQENFQPLDDAGVLTLVEDGAEIAPGVRFRRSGGHTPHHQVIMIQSGGETAVFTADMYPTTAHIPDPWMTGYDLLPVQSLEFKRAFAREAIEGEYLIFFEHEPSMAAGRLRDVNGRRSVERVR